MRKASIHVLLLTALLAAVIGAQPAAAVGYVQPLEDYESATGATNLARGIVRGADGAPVAGATLQALKWPDSASLSEDLESSISPTVIATAVTNDSGAYLLGAGGLSMSIGSSNVDIVVDAESGQLAHSLIVTPASGKVMVTTQGSEDPGVKVLSAEGLLNDPAAIAVDFQLPEPTTDAADPADSEIVMALGGAAGGTCTLKSTFVANTQINASYATLGSGHSRAYTYSVGTESVLGVATSAQVNSGYASVGVAKVKHTSGASSFSPTSSKGGVLYKTQFLYGRYRCYYPVTSTRGYWKVHPIKWWGGAMTSSTSVVPSAGYCADYLAGTGAVKNRGKGQTFTSGVGVKGSIGIDLSARTDHSTSHLLNFTFTTKRKLCSASPDGPMAGPGVTVVK